MAPQSQGAYAEMNTPTVPLCVDLDGTLIKTDLLYESLVALARKNPLALFLVPFWLLRGRAFLKRQLAERIELHYDLLPYREDVLDYLRNQKDQGRSLMLATASDQILADQVAGHLGLFDRVIGSDGQNNLKGKRKREQIQAVSQQYDYLGDSKADLPLWREAQNALMVTNDQDLIKRVKTTTNVKATYATNKFTLKLFLRSLRIHQWVKNLLIFVPLVMAHRVSDLPLLSQAMLGFFSFSFCASGVYLTNDLLDLESDRALLTKKNRPLASGDLSIPAGISLATILFLASLVVATVLPGDFFLVLIGYFILTSSYSMGLKRIAILDIVLLASLYTIRIFAGGMAVTVPVSHWLLAFSLFFFFSLACMKRFSELYSVRKQKLSMAKGRGYHADDLEQIASFGSASGYIAILVLALYINSTEVAALYTHPAALWLLCPLLLYWITRIWLLAHRGLVHEDPIVFAIRDVVSYGIGVLSLILLFLAR